MQMTLDLYYTTLLQDTMSRGIQLYCTNVDLVFRFSKMSV